MNFFVFPGASTAATETNSEHSIVDRLRPSDFGYSFSSEFESAVWAKLNDPQFILSCQLICKARLQMIVASTNAWAYCAHQAKRLNISENWSVEAFCQEVICDIYVRYSHAAYLEHWLKYISKERLLLLHIEDLRVNTEEVVRAACCHAGFSIKQYSIPDAKKTNSSRERFRFTTHILKVLLLDSTKKLGYNSSYVATTSVPTGLRLHPRTLCLSWLGSNNKNVLAE